MKRFLVRRFFTGLLTVWGAATLIFVALQCVPGGLAESLAGSEAAFYPGMVDRIKAQYGLEKPIYVQYGIWLSNALRGDLGTSTKSRRPVVKELMARGGVTLQLTIMASLLSIIVGVPGGVLAALHRRKASGVLMQVTSILGLSIPSFVLATILIYVVSKTGIGLPVAGYTPPGEGLTRNLASMTLPAITLGAISMAVVMRFTRSSVLEALTEQYVVTARSKGLHPYTVLTRHVLKNALIPTVTVIGLNIGYLMGGAIIVETIYALPGLGRYVLLGLMSRDHWVVQGVVLVAAIVFVSVAVIADIIYAWLDPRIRY